MFQENGELERDLHLEPLHPDSDHPIQPGETVELTFELPAEARGRWILEFDLVAEQVAWFEVLGSPVVRRDIEVC